VRNGYALIMSIACGIVTLGDGRNDVIWVGGNLGKLGE